MKAICLVLFAMTAVQISFAQLSAKYKTYEQKWSKGLRYGLFKPANYDPKNSYPLVLYLHGANDTISRDIPWYHESVQRENPAFVLAPKCTNPDQGWGNTWAHAHSPAMMKTLQVIDSLSSTYNIDKNRLYVYGISMGGFGVFSVLAKEQGKFAAGYAICGGSSEAAASKLLNTPLWIFHGEADDVVGVQYSRQIYQEIKKEGGQVVRYTEYPGVRHNSWENAAREKTLHRWLLAQRKGKTSASPQRVDALKAKLQNDNTIVLTWSIPAADEKSNRAVWYYKIFRDDKLLAELDGDLSAFTDKDARRGMRRYHMVAVNYNFKESNPSPSVSVTTP